MITPIALVNSSLESLVLAVRDGSPTKGFEQVLFDNLEDLVDPKTFGFYRAWALPWIEEVVAARENTAIKGLDVTVQTKFEPDSGLVVSFHVGAYCMNYGLMVFPGERSEAEFQQHLEDQLCNTLPVQPSPTAANQVLVSGWLADFESYLGTMPLSGYFVQPLRTAMLNHAVTPDMAIDVVIGYCPALIDRAVVASRITFIMPAGELIVSQLN